MDNIPETSEAETAPLGSVASRSDELHATEEPRDSKAHLMKMLTFAPDVTGPQSSTIRFSITDEEEAIEIWAEASEEEDENFDEEDEEEKEDEVQKKDQGEEAEPETKAEAEAEPEPEAEAEAEAEPEDEEEDQEEDFEIEEEEGEEEESGEESEDETPEEEKILMDYQFPVPKEIKVKSDSDLSKIPSEVLGERNAMLQLLKDLLAERPNLTLRNRYLEYKSFQYLKTLQVAGSPPIDDGSNLEDEAEKDRYMNFLGNYRKESEGIRARENQVKQSLDYIREKLRDRLSNDAETFGELTSREAGVAVDLIFSTNGRRLTQKRVEEIIRRQTARRKQVAHERYTFIRRWYMFEEIDARIRRLETLGPGMKISDYEADFSAILDAKTKIDKKNNELQEARARVCGIMAAITHGKVKLSYLNDEIDYKKNCYNRILDSVKRQREAVSSMRSQLSNTRNRYLKKRETAGLMLASPALREMERVQDLRDLWRDKVDHMRSQIRRPRKTGN